MHVTTSEGGKSILANNLRSLQALKSIHERTPSKRTQFSIELLEGLIADSQNPKNYTNAIYMPGASGWPLSKKLEAHISCINRSVDSIVRNAFKDAAETIKPIIYNGLPKQKKEY